MAIIGRATRYNLAGDLIQWSLAKEAVIDAVEQIRTHLLTPILLAGKFDLAHTALTNRLAKNPFARLGGDGGPRLCWLGRGVHMRFRCSMSGSGWVAIACRRSGGGGSHVDGCWVMALVMFSWGAMAAGRSMGS